MDPSKQRAGYSVNAMIAGTSLCETRDPEAFLDAAASSTSAHVLGSKA